MYPRPPGQGKTIQIDEEMRSVEIAYRVWTGLRAACSEMQLSASPFSGLVEVAARRIQGLRFRLCLCHSLCSG